jgi:hypothetical protein
MDLEEKELLINLRQQLNDNYERNSLYERQRQMSLRWAKNKSKLKKLKELDNLRKKYPEKNL